MASYRSFRGSKGTLGPCRAVCLWRVGLESCWGSAVSHPYGSFSCRFCGFQEGAFSMASYRSFRGSKGTLGPCRAVCLWRVGLESCWGSAVSHPYGSFSCRFCGFQEGAFSMATVCVRRFRLRSVSSRPYGSFSCRFCGFQEGAFSMASYRSFRGSKGTLGPCRAVCLWRVGLESCWGSAFASLFGPILCRLRSVSSRPYGSFSCRFCGFQEGAFSMASYRSFRGSKGTLGPCRAVCLWRVGLESCWGSAVSHPYGSFSCRFCGFQEGAFSMASYRSFRGSKGTLGPCRAVCLWRVGLESCWGSAVSHPYGSFSCRFCGFQEGAFSMATVRVRRFRLRSVSSRPYGSFSCRFCGFQEGAFSMASYRSFRGSKGTLGPCRAVCLWRVGLELLGLCRFASVRELFVILWLPCVFDGFLLALGSLFESSVFGLWFESFNVSRLPRSPDGVR